MLDNRFAGICCTILQQEVDGLQCNTSSWETHWPLYYTCWLMTRAALLWWGCIGSSLCKWACSARMITSIHVCRASTSPLRHPHWSRHTSPTPPIHHTPWVPPHMRTYTHTPWPETSSPQVTDVCMWGDDCNEYWVTEVISLPFCLMLPPTLTLQPPGVSKPTPSFFFQMATFGPSGTPVSSSRKDLPIMSFLLLWKQILLLERKNQTFLSFWQKLWFLLPWHRQTGTTEINVALIYCLKLHQLDT